MNILYIILKHVIWRFQIYNLFREIFKFKIKAIMYFAKFVNAFVKPRNLNFQYFWWFGLSDKFSFRRYIICWGNLSLSKIIGGGGGAPRTAASFYSANMCIRCLLLKYRLIFLLVFLYLMSLKPRQTLSRLVKNISLYFIRKHLMIYNYCGICFNVWSQCGKFFKYMYCGYLLTNSLSNDHVLICVLTFIF